MILMKHHTGTVYNVSVYIKEEIQVQTISGDIYIVVHGGLILVVFDSQF